MPQMTSVHLEKLWSLASTGIGVVPQAGQFVEPLSAIYPVEAVNEVEQALVNGIFSLQSVIKTLTARQQIRFYTISRSESAFYRNVNTMKEWTCW